MRKLQNCWLIFRKFFIQPEIRKKLENELLIVNAYLAAYFLNKQNYRENEGEKIRN